MLEMTADRLVLVEGGTASDYDGSLDDYIASVLLGDAKSGEKAASKVNKKEARRAAAAARDQAQALKKSAREAEAKLARLAEERSAIDQAMFDPKQAAPPLASLSMSELMKKRAEIERALEQAETHWLSASEALERLAA